MQDPKFALVFLVPTNAKGVKFICRVSNEQRAAVLGSPFDYPLSSRLDENDAIFIMDDVFIPWEDVFVCGDIEKANTFFPQQRLRAALSAARLHAARGQARLHLRTADQGDRNGGDAAGFAASRPISARSSPGAHACGRCRTRWRATPTHGPTALCCRMPRPARPITCWRRTPMCRSSTRSKRPSLSSLIYLNSHARDFTGARIAQIPRSLRARLGRRHRGRAGQADETVMGCDRQRVRRAATSSTRSTIPAATRKSAASRSSAPTPRAKRRDGRLSPRSCMAEYDLDGWTAPDLVNPDDVSVLGR